MFAFSDFCLVNTIHLFLKLTGLNQAFMFGCVIYDFVLKFLVVYNYLRTK